jgi:hypothetical protein
MAITIIKQPIKREKDLYKVTVKYIVETIEFIHADNDTEAKFKTLQKYPSFLSVQSEKQV